jgi:HflK protein
MIDFLLRVLWETWDILKEASIFLLFGFLLAGVLAVLVPQRLLTKLLGTGKIKSVLWAATIGAPLPLCSCGVVPAALGLRRQGATPGATVGFLIATPETGVDSISLTYALMDPIITVFRPLAAIATAIAAGIATNFLGTPRMPAPLRGRDSSGDDGSDSGPDHEHHHHGHDHHHDFLLDATNALNDVAITRSPLQAGKRVLHYAFRQLLDDTSYWLVLGILLSGVVAAAIPPSFIEKYLGNEIASMLLMLAIGIPIYTCASASTPLAAALVMKGLNPGAALVFLLAGPATNLGSLVLLFKFLGSRVLAVYLAAIIVVTLAAGFGLNWIYRAWQLDPRATFGQTTSFIPDSVKLGAAVVLMGLLLVSMARTHVPDEWIWLRDRFARLTGLWLTARRVALAALGATVLLYLGSGLFTVQPGEAGIKSRFGRIFGPEVSPGLHYRFPWPIETHRIVPKQRIQRIEFGFRSSTGSQPRKMSKERLTLAGWNSPTPSAVETDGTFFQKDVSPEDEAFHLTADGNLINVKSALQYHVQDTLAYALNVADPQALVRSATLAAIRDVIVTNSIDAIYTVSRDEIEESVIRRVQADLDAARSGMAVLSYRLLYVHAPDEVHDAFRDVASAQEDKLRTINRANIFAVEDVNQAKGEAAAMMEQALAFKAQQIRHATGEAIAFTMRLDEYQRAPELTKFRLQLETLEEALPGVQKFVRPGAGEMRDFDMWLLQPSGTQKK